MQCVVTLSRELKLTQIHVLTHLALVTSTKIRGKLGTNFLNGNYYY